MKRLKLEITQDHINRGTQNLALECPIAVSLLDEGFFDVWVGVKQVFLREHESSESIRLNLSKRARQFVSDFDSRKIVAPGVYYLTRREGEILDESQNYEDEF